MWSCLQSCLQQDKNTCSPGAAPQCSAVGALLCSVYSCWERKYFSSGFMLEHFVLWSLLSAVWCWSSCCSPGGLPSLPAWAVLSSRGDWVPFPNLDAVLQIGLFVCSDCGSLYHTHQLLPPSQPRAALLLTFTQSSAECLHFFHLDIQALKESLTVLVAQISAGCLTKSKGKEDVHEDCSWCLSHLPEGLAKLWKLSNYAFFCTAKG